MQWNDMYAIVPRLSSVGLCSQIIRGIALYHEVSAVTVTQAHRAGKNVCN